MRYFTLAICLFLSMPCLAQPAEVRNAYQAIPHRFTPFEASGAKMAEADKAYLAANFQLVNQAVVAKVQAMQSKDYAGYDSKADPLLRQLKAQRPPTSLSKYHELVIAALVYQRAYFKSWSLTPSAPFNARDPKVQAASSRLREAYSILLNQYPDQAKQVQDSFFDHLCALDFI